ncbi:hypothetical protein [uncultured Deinococcus sp.]|uniref:hypothetical protein n=1 Tax=uncultured Deinococcus sp. TaxID=158789 RepID=UPI0025D3BD35|nr:hypothetical protein [uncultured Deinococcus sp.]
MRRHARPRPLLTRTLLLCSLLLTACAGSPTAPVTPSPPGGGQPLPPADAETLAATDRHARTLAAQFTGGHAAALSEALSAAGIAVRRLSGDVLRPAAEPALGLAVAEHDPEALAQLQFRGAAVTLQDVADTLKVLWPQADAARLPALIQADLRAGVASRVPTVRFWARFVVALGSPSSGEANLLDSTDPRTVTVTAAQQGLLLLRLAGSTARLAQGRGAAVPTALRLRPQAAAAPCTFGSTEGTLMDGAASAITTGVGELLGYLDSVSALPGESAADTAAGQLGTANLVLSYVKFTLSLASFRLDLTTDAVTVQRTQSTSHEGDGVVTARARVAYDLNANWQYANCMRLALNVAGIDFSVPNAGVVEGADVRWRIFAAQGAGSYADQHLSVIAARPGEEIMHDKTGADGVAAVQFEGLRQKEDLGPAPRAVAKPGEVSAITSIKGSALAADLVDAFGIGAGGVGGLLNLPTELLYRMWPLSATVPLTVNDWAPACSEVTGDTCWLGTVTVTDHREEITVLRDPNKQPAGSDVTVADASATYTVVGGSDPGGPGQAVSVETQGTFQSHYVRRSRYDATYDVLCANGKTKTDVARATLDEESSAQFRFDDTFSLQVAPDGAYTMTLSYREGARRRGVLGTIRSTAFYKGGCNPYHDRDTSTETANERQHAWGDFKVGGHAHTEDGVTSFAGSKTLTLRVDGLPTTRTITWTIRRVTLP